MNPNCILFQRERERESRRSPVVRAWSVGAMVLGKYLEPKRLTNLDNSRARVYCSCSRCGWGLFGHFFLSSIFSLFFLTLWETARYGLKKVPQRAVKPKTPTKSSREWYENTSL